MVRELHPLHGPHDPTTSTPPRRPGSLRRTTTHDSLRPDGLLGAVHLVARGRDLQTGAGGDARVVSSASLDVRIDFVNARTVTAITSDPPAAELEALVGTAASSGFRRAVEVAMPDARLTHSLRFQLLDDLPTAVLVGGYAVGAGGARLVRSPRMKVLQQADICAGWATGGTILNEMADLGAPPVVTGPPAPDLQPADDPLAWHACGPLPPHGMRRRRRLDLWRDGGLVAIECFFRDSHFDPAGLETVVHEYTVQASLDPATMRFVSCEAAIGALPWIECPAAAASAGRLAGAPADGLRDWVRETFVGTSTCTHLNDTLRSLEDVAVLSDLVAPA
jgi:hypothetical protein